MSHVEKKTTIYLSTGIATSCKVCSTDIAYDDIAKQINHYLDHGYKVIHMGQETFESDAGLEHRTVAVLSL
jgi:hypothetical protein